MNLKRKPQPRTERLSPVAGEFYKSLPPGDRARVQALVQSLLEDPEVDGMRIVQLPPSPVRWRVLVDPRFTVYFRATDDQVLVDSINETRPSIKAILAEERAPYVV